MTTLSDLMLAKGIGMRRLSEDSGVPWEMLFGICAGEIELKRCEAGMVRRLAQALDMSVAEILDLEQEALVPNDENLEKGLPRYVQKSIDDLKQGKYPIDLLLDDLYGSINSAFWDGEISKEQAEYLRSKYLGLRRLRHR